MASEFGAEGMQFARPRKLDSEIGQCFLWFVGGTVHVDGDGTGGFAPFRPSNTSGMTSATTLVVSATVRSRKVSSNALTGASPHAGTHPPGFLRASMAVKWSGDDIA